MTTYTAANVDAAAYLETRIVAAQEQLAEEVRAREKEAEARARDERERAIKSLASRLHDQLGEELLVALEALGLTYAAEQTGSHAIPYAIFALPPEGYRVRLTLGSDYDEILVADPDRPGDFYAKLVTRVWLQNTNGATELLAAFDTLRTKHAEYLAQQAEIEAAKAEKAEKAEKAAQQASDAASDAAEATTATSTVIITAPAAQPVQILASNDYARTVLLTARSDYALTANLGWDGSATLMALRVRRDHDDAGHEVPLAAEEMRALVTAYAAWMEDVATRTSQKRKAEAEALRDYEEDMPF